MRGGRHRRGRGGQGRLIDTPCTRRRFLRGLALLAASPLALRCGGPAGPSGDDFATQAATYDRDLVCNDTKGLWPAELKTRTDNEYRDNSTQPGQACFNCSNFIPPKPRGTCATCRTVKGPIHPLGWCKSWTEKK